MGKRETAARRRRVRGSRLPGPLLPLAATPHSRGQRGPPYLVGNLVCFADTEMVMKNSSGLRVCIDKTIAKGRGSRTDLAQLLGITGLALARPMPERLGSRGAEALRFIPRTCASDRAWRPCSPWTWPWRCPQAAAAGQARLESSEDAKHERSTCQRPWPCRSAVLSP